MKVSVVIPVHNKGPYLRACLDSVFAQTFTEFEVIAVDDASTDDSAQILASITDPRFRWLRTERNVGPGGAAQRAMDAAVGEYIMRVDADDVMFPDRFATQVRMLDEDPSLGACSAYVQLMTDPTIIYHVPLDDAACKARLLFGVALNQQVTAYRREVLVRHDIRFGDDWPHYGEDWMQHLALARVTRFKNLDRPLAWYRTGSNNIAHGRDRAKDLRGLYRHVFAHYDIPITEEQLDLQLYTVKCFPRPITADSVGAYRNWLDALARMDQERRIFEPVAFQRQLDKAWYDLLYHLPSNGWGPVLSYLKRGPRLDRQRSYYLIASLFAGRRTKALRS
ncbi:MAG: glycosyltransferase [Flavobacteriales bacterium]|nr:glycosyltransferase [Flavobacteriales bacterium]